MDLFRDLESYFAEFPGIGPRQAKRFVYFLVHKNKSWSSELARLVSELHTGISICSECFRIFPRALAHSQKTADNNTSLCPICTNRHRDHGVLMIVSRDLDLEAIEKSGVYHGLYFVLGGTVPILGKEPEKKIRLNELNAKVKRMMVPSDPLISPLREIVIATSANPEGEHTADYIKEQLTTVIASSTAQNSQQNGQQNPVRISYLGRGLSTGSELEYSDKETLKNALENRR